MAKLSTKAKLYYEGFQNIGITLVYIEKYVELWIALRFFKSCVILVQSILEF